MRILNLLIALMFVSVAMAQQKPSDLDKSPLDVSYFPANYPILKMKGQAGDEPSARVVYSRPQQKGREIFGGEVKYNEVWRLGANEATELELFKPAKIGGKKVPKGRYTLYCIPSENKWTIIINKENYIWGGFTYKSEKDVARVEAPVKKNGEKVEAFTMYFDQNNLNMLWEDLKVSLPVSF
jgi:hypothetical protein